MKKLLTAIGCALVLTACEPRADAPKPEPTPSATETPSPAPTASPRECFEGVREVTAVGGGKSVHVNCRECVDGKWKPCKD